MFLIIFMGYLFLQIMVLISVVFITLMERKLLASFMIRMGPNYVIYSGFLQSVTDAVKLFFKEMISSYMVNLNFFLLSPIASMTLALFLWVLYPFFEGGLYFMFSLLFFICLSSLGVFPILMMGWSSNCKYSILGSIRSVAQMLSYEISLIIILLILIWFINSFNFLNMGTNQNFILNIFIFLPVFFIIFVSFLAELNRTPYDFSEGESELVSGFNTEYGSGGFVLIFLSEYANIIFMSFLISFMFFNVGGGLNFIVCFNSVLIMFFIIWVRATLPRYRYDMLMNLAWKSYLPLSLSFFCFYIMIFYFYMLV